MTKKLEELFGFPSTDDAEEPAQKTTEEHIPALNESLAQLDKIELALPAVRGLESSDGEMDELAAKATKEFDNLMDLGMNVDSRYASEIFNVASQMLGHAITAKTAKLNKKLKMVDLQMKKLKLDQDRKENPEVETAHGQVLSRNDLLERLMSNRDQKTD